MIDKRSAAVVVIGAISKQNNGPTPLGDMNRMKRRVRKYFSGDYGSAEVRGGAIKESREDKEEGIL